MMERDFAAELRERFGLKERELIEEWWEIHGGGGYVAPLRYSRESAFANRCPEERVVHVRRYRLKKGKSK